MKQLHVKDIFISLVTSIISVFIFYLTIVLLGVLFILTVGNLLVILINLIAIPLSGEAIEITDLFGSSFADPSLMIAFKFSLSVFLMWQFYLAVIVLVVLDVVIRQLNVLPLTDSPYVNGLIVYLILGIVFGYIIKWISLYQMGMSIPTPSLLTGFFLAHYHLAYFLHYMTQKGGLKKLFGKRKAKKHRHSSDEDKKIY